MNKIRKVLKSRYIYLIIFLVGAAVFSYPLISQTLNKNNQTKAITNYEEALEELTQSELNRKKENARKYNEYINRLEGSVAEELTDEERMLADIEYMQVLDISEVLGYVEIPKLDILLPIYYGTSEEVMQRGIGHMERTSIPIGGEGSHAVLSGHRGLPSGRMFRDLDKLDIDDIFIISTLDETMYYQVDQIKIVEPTDAESLGTVEGKDYVTLLTCDPYMINSHRLLVRGIRTAYDEDLREQGYKSKISFYQRYIEYFIIIFIFTFIILATWLIRYYFRRRRRKLYE